jgi:hypothetical protein
MNEVKEVDGKHYHPGSEPAPYGWARTTGERITLPNTDGLWCEIVNQKPFTFDIKGKLAVVTSGFRNPDLNGNASLAIDMLRRGDLDEIKATMKLLGLPSCCRLNIAKDFKVFFAEREKK